MAISTTNYDLVAQTMALLRDGLKPFVAREMASAMGGEWVKQVAGNHKFPKDVLQTFDKETGGDVKLLLELMWNYWNLAFRTTLGPAERSMVSELRDFRNRWAHQKTFSSDDAYRVMDSAERLLTAISAPRATDLKGAVVAQRLEAPVYRRRRPGDGAANQFWGWQDPFHAGPVSSVFRGQADRDARDRRTGPTAKCQ